MPDLLYTFGLDRLAQRVQLDKPGLFVACAELDLDQFVMLKCTIELFADGFSKPVLAQSDNRF